MINTCFKMLLHVVFFYFDHASNSLSLPRLGLAQGLSLHLVYTSPSLHRALVYKHCVYVLSVIECDSLLTRVHKLECLWTLDSNCDAICSVGAAIPEANAT